MDKLFEIEFFGLVAENSQKIANEQMQCAYGEFIAHINAVSQSEKDLTVILRKLNITRAELVFLSTQIQHEQGEKRPEICLS